MVNGYGVCSNLASSGEPPPPASHDHVNHCLYLYLRHSDSDYQTWRCMDAVGVGMCWPRQVQWSATDRRGWRCFTLGRCDRLWTRHCRHYDTDVAALPAAWTVLLRPRRSLPVHGRQQGTSPADCLCNAHHRGNSQLIQLSSACNYLTAHLATTATATTITTTITTAAADAAAAWSLLRQDITDRMLFLSPNQQCQSTERCRRLGPGFVPFATNNPGLQWLLWHCWLGDMERGRRKRVRWNADVNA